MFENIFFIEDFYVILSKYWRFLENGFRLKTSLHKRYICRQFCTEYCSDYTTLSKTDVNAHHWITDGASVVFIRYMIAII